jgi:hypothetical protein
VLSPDSPSTSSPFSSSSSVSALGQGNLQPLFNLAIVEQLTSTLNSIQVPLSLTANVSPSLGGVTTINIPLSSNSLPRIPRSCLVSIIPHVLSNMINAVVPSFLSSLPFLYDSSTSLSAVELEPSSPLQNFSLPQIPIPHSSLPVPPSSPSRDAPLLYNYFPLPSMRLSFASLNTSEPERRECFEPWMYSIVETPDASTFGNVGAQYPFSIMTNLRVSASFLLGVLFNTFSLFLDPFLKPSVVHALTDIGTSGLNRNPDFSTPRVELFYRLVNSLVFFFYYRFLFAFLRYIQDFNSILAKEAV